MDLEIALFQRLKKPVVTRTSPTQTSIQSIGSCADCVLLVFAKTAVPNSMKKERTHSGRAKAEGCQTAGVRTEQKGLSYPVPDFSMIRFNLTSYWSGSCLSKTMKGGF